MAKQIFQLEDSLKGEIDSVLDRVRQLERVLDKQTADIEAFRQEYFALLQAVRRIEGRLKTIDERVEKIENDVRVIFTRLERVETRLALRANQSPVRLRFKDLFRGPAGSRCR